MFAECTIHYDIKNGGGGGGGGGDIYVFVEKQILVISLSYVWEHV